MEKSVTFSHETLHSVANHLAVIVSYAALLMNEAATDRERADLTEIRQNARAAANLLGRPLADND